MPNQLEDIELRSEEVQDILTRVPHWMIRWGSLLFFTLIVMILVLAWFIKYPDIISSSAVVTTEIPPQKEYARITADIEAVLVEDGDEVEEDQPLAILEHSGDYSDILFLKKILDTINIRNKSFVFPDIPILFLGDIESQFALFENNYDIYRLNKKLQPFENQAQASHYTSSQLKNRLQSTEGQLKSEELKYKIAKETMENYERLYKKGSFAKADYERERLAFLQAEQSLENLKISISQLKESISSTRSASRGIEIDQTRQSKIEFKAVIQSFNQLKKSIEDWEMQYVLKADVKGKVSFLKYWAENQTVNASDLVFTVIPSESSNYIAKLKAPARNSGKIKIGQEVNIKLENYPNTEYGVLQGKVHLISQLPDEEGNYLIDVLLPSTLITSYDKEIAFKQEMQGSGDIILEDLRLLDRLLYQFKKIVERE